MYEFWYDYIKPKCGKNVKRCYMDTYSFITCTIIDDIYKDIAEDVEARFDTLNYEIDKPLPEIKNKKLAGLMKDELERQIMRKFIGLRSKTVGYLKENGDEYRKSKGTKQCVIKRILKFQDYQNCLKASQIINTANHSEKKEIKEDFLKEDQRKFIERNKLILKSQQRFKI